MTNPTREDYERVAAAMLAIVADGKVIPVAPFLFGEWAALLTAAAERMTWRPMSDAPRNGTEILCLQADGTITIGVWTTTEEMAGCAITDYDKVPRWFEHFGAYLDGTFRWLPLPPAPKTEGAE